MNMVDYFGTHEGDANSGGTRQRATTELREGGAAMRGGRKCVENHWGRAWKLDLERCFLALVE